MIILIDNYDSFTYNLAHYFGQLGYPPTIYRNDEHSAETILSFKPNAIILSPGPRSPIEAGICVSLIQQASKQEIPIFGVCLGHQAIGHAFGGKIIRAHPPIHGKVKKVTHNHSILFKEVTQTFEVTRYHSLIIKETTLPNCLEVTCTSAENHEESMIMGVQHKTLPIFGVQFHPESIRTQDGLQIIKNFINYANL